MDYRQTLIALAERFAAARSISEATVANKAGCDGQFFVRLRNGKSCTVDTLNRLIAWFADNWPDDAQWPDGVPRPAPDRVPAEAAA